MTFCRLGDPYKPCHCCWEGSHPKLCFDMSCMFTCLLDLFKVIFYFLLGQITMNNRHLGNMFVSPKTLTLSKSKTFTLKNHRHPDFYLDFPGLRWMCPCGGCKTIACRGLNDDAHQLWLLEGNIHCNQHFVKLQEVWSNMDWKVNLLFFGGIGVELFGLQIHRPPPNCSTKRMACTYCIPSKT